jgi:hypothetical protein
MAGLHRICLHDCLGKVLYVNPDHIGSARPVNVDLGDNPKGKTVLEIDGMRHEVLETEEQIDKLIKELKE